MSLDGAANVQSRIAAIQEKIVTPSSQERPPVAVTGLGGENSASTGAAGITGAAAKSTSPFASEYVK